MEGYGTPESWRVLPSSESERSECSVGVECQRIRMEFRMIAMSITWASADGSAGKSVHTWPKRATKKSIRRLIYDDGAMMAALMNEINSRPIPAFPYFFTHLYQRYR